MKGGGVLDLQRRSQQIGRIRIGQQVGTGKTGRDGKEKTRPARLSTFRFTTQSKVMADAVAAQFGGTVQPWQNELEVITTRDSIAITVPPRNEVITQWYELWSGGGCQRRCDSEHDIISNGPCKCAPLLAGFTDPDDRARERYRLAHENPPKACALKTRISVMVPDLPGLGVWRIDTSSYYAGTEIIDAAYLMQEARALDIFLPAILRIDHRSRVAGGETKKFPVLVVEVLATFRQITSGELAAGGINAQLPPAPGEPQRAITAGAPQTTPGPVMAPGKTPHRELVADKGSTGPGAAGSPGSPMVPSETLGQAVPLPRETGDPGDSDPADAADVIVARARAAQTVEEFLAITQDAERLGLMDEYVGAEVIDDDGLETYEPLRGYLQALWRSKGAAR